MTRKRIPCLFGATAIALAVLLPGCGQPANSSEENLSKAQAALETALDAWARKETPGQLAAIDPDFKAGYRLLSFLTVEAKPLDETLTQFRFRVALTLQDQQGKSLDKEAVFLVQLGDPIAIQREGQPTKR